MLSAALCQRLLGDIQHSGATLTELFITVLSSSELSTHPVAGEPSRNARHLLETLYGITTSRDSVLEWIQGMATKIYMAEIRELTKRQNGMQFNAATSLEEQTTQFDIEAITMRVNAHVPMLSRLVCALLSADPELVARRAKYAVSGKSRRKQKQKHQQHVRSSESPVSAAISVAEQRTASDVAHSESESCSLRVEANVDVQMDHGEDLVHGEDDEYWDVLEDLDEEIMPASKLCVTLIVGP